MMSKADALRRKQSIKSKINDIYIGDKPGVFLSGLICALNDAVCAEEIVEG